VTIANAARISSIVRFLNARRDGWHELNSSMFAVSGGMKLLNVQGGEISYISIGPGGMIQTRPDTTSTEHGFFEQLGLARTPQPVDARRDEAVLCKLLGTEAAAIACHFQ
jgi:hypothetical protein